MVSKVQACVHQEKSTGLDLRECVRILHPDAIRAEIVEIVRIHHHSGISPFQAPGKARPGLQYYWYASNY